MLQVDNCLNESPVMGLMGHSKCQCQQIVVRCKRIALQFEQLANVDSVASNEHLTERIARICSILCKAKSRRGKGISCQWQTAPASDWTGRCCGKLFGRRLRNGRFPRTKSAASLRRVAAASRMVGKADPCPVAAPEKKVRRVAVGAAADAAAAHGKRLPRRRRRRPPLATFNSLEIQFGRPSLRP